jgi:putative FmdB family regulatory protein
MPFYEYRCDACGHEFEAMQKMSEPALSDCPQCGAAKLTKLISAGGFQLKGGGWYRSGNGGTSENSGGHSCGGGSCPSCQ